jgi:hypothetical protein
MCVVTVEIGNQQYVSQLRVVSSLLVEPSLSLLVALVVCGVVSIGVVAGGRTFVYIDRRGGSSGGRGGGQTM